MAQAIGGRTTGDTHTHKSTSKIVFSPRFILIIDVLEHAGKKFSSIRQCVWNVEKIRVRGCVCAVQAMCTHSYTFPPYLRARERNFENVNKSILFVRYSKGLNWKSIKNVFKIMPLNDGIRLVATSDNIRLSISMGKIKMMSLKKVHGGILGFCQGVKFTMLASLCEKSMHTSNVKDSFWTISKSYWAWTWFASVCTDVNNVQLLQIYRNKNSWNSPMNAENILYINLQRTLTCFQ